MLSWIEAGFEPASVPAKTMPWIGLSGRTYRLDHENLRTFILKGADLYLIARGNAVLWVGCSLDLVSEPAIRLKFRKALGVGEVASDIRREKKTLARVYTLLHEKQAEAGK